jgi:hypothetical protein
MECVVGTKAEADLERVFLRHLLSFPCLVAALTSYLWQQLFGLSAATRSTSLRRQRTCNQALFECLQRAPAAIVALPNFDDWWEA